MTTLHYKIYPNLYKDSVSLMQVSAQLSVLPGVSQVSVAMATPANLERMQDAGLQLDIQAKPSDLLIALNADETSGQDALAIADALLKPAKPDDQAGPQAVPLSSIEMGLQQKPEANLALISVPGPYAAAEAMKALRQGLNVMLFSDNVPEAEEHALKAYATSQNLLVMGPDCGTAIVNGIPLGFANVVRAGAIGIVAASGTGLQEVSCRIHHLGEGVSQALGTGGRDLHAEIGGQSMCQALKLLAADANTRLIVLISKPPAAAVTQKVLDLARDCGKPVVVHFLGADHESLTQYGVIPASSLRHAADTAVALLRQQPLPAAVSVPAERLKQAQSVVRQMRPEQTDIRGVFAGGTFCYEGQLALKSQGLHCCSNVPIKGATAFEAQTHPSGHILLDMGDDSFTQGRPHPMIDPTLRNARLQQEAADPRTAVLLFDVVIGYGASMHPVDELLSVLSEAQHQASQQGRSLLAIAHVCGTSLDPQSYQQQVSALQAAGVLVAASNVEAALLAATVANDQAGKNQ